MKHAKYFLLTLAALAIVACQNSVLDLPQDQLENEPTKGDYYSDPVRDIDMNKVDAFEEDDTKDTAKTLVVNAVGQEHTFYDDASDWVSFSAEAGKSYTIETYIYGVADTIATLYDGTTKLASNDDKTSNDRGSKFVFKPKTTKVYSLLVASYQNKKGTNRGYTLEVRTDEGPTPSITLPQNKKAWTLLVYLDADNNLSSYGGKDIEELWSVGSDQDNVNLVVLWDDAGSKHGYYYIEKGKATLLKDVGEVNMGDPATANAFSTFAALNFPADNYMWVWWNHGGAVDRNAQTASGIFGSRGVAWDDSNNGDHLSEVEQTQCMSHLTTALGKKLAIIGFDACLMATAEIYYQYKDFADYIVASEQNEPGDGWDWKFASVFKTNPTSEQVTKQVFDAYKTWYGKTKNVTFSVGSLSKVTTFSNALNAFTDAAIASNADKSYFKPIAQAQTKFAGTSKLTNDLYDFLNKVTVSTSISQGVKDKAAAAKDALSAMILYNWSDSTWVNKAYGLSVTLRADTTVYSLLDICVDTSWDEFLTYAGMPSSW